MLMVFVCTYGERFMATFCFLFFVVVVVVFLGLWEEMVACAWCLRVHMVSGLWLLFVSSSL